MNAPRHALPLTDARLDVLLNVRDHGSIGESSRRMLFWAVDQGYVALAVDGNLILRADGDEALRLNREHALDIGRFQRGRGALAGSGMQYGTTGVCRCGAKFRSNESPSASGRSRVREQHQRHLAEVQGVAS